MLLKKVETIGKIESLFDSSNVKASSYNKANQKLVITFGGGAQYEYAGVEPTDYARFELAESQGKHLNKLIKPNYPFTKVAEGVEVTDLESEINDLLLREIVDFEKIFMEQIGDIYMNHIDGERISTNKLEFVKSTIEKLLAANANYNKSVA